MRHVDDGMLRRLCDEPLTVRTSDRAHVESCGRCTTRLAEIKLDAESAMAALSSPAPDIHPSAALDQLHARLETEQIAPAGRPSRRLAGLYETQIKNRMVALYSSVAAAVLIAALALTPAGSLAQSILTIFQPQQVAILPVSSGDLRHLLQLRRLGTIHFGAQPQPQTVSTAAAAEAASGLHVVVPSSLPSGISTSVSYQVVPGSSASFTFNAAKAQAAAARAHKTLPPMPANINGSTLQVTTGNAVVAVYGPASRIPDLVIGEMKVPVVTSTGVTAQQLEDYVLRLPGISSQLAQEIKSIGDPTSTLPLPVPMNLARGQKVGVQGVQGVSVGDNSGLGSAVIWVKDGVIYGVGGAMSQDEALSIAASLH